jgi:hypothetical protein
MLDDVSSFLGKDDPMSGKLKYGGTGFLVGYRGDGAQLPYLATCRHVARELKSNFVIRVNTRPANISHVGSHAIRVAKAEWIYPYDDTVDLAVTHLMLNNDAYDAVYMVLNDLMPREPIVCGDPVSIVGLFRLHFGSQRNLPIVHTGNVALLPNPNEKIPQNDGGRTIEVECYLVEAQTLEGLSGSPVFVREVVFLPEGEFKDGAIERPVAFGSVSLLGVYSGAWDGEPGAILAEDRGLSGNLRVPVGMGLVVPVEKLETLLRDNPELKKQRRDFAEKSRSAMAASTDAVFPMVRSVDSARPATDGNPTHREDFNSLVGAAARKREQED